MWKRIEIVLIKTKINWIITKKKRGITNNNRIVKIKEKSRGKDKEIKWNKNEIINVNQNH